MVQDDVCGLSIYSWEASDFLNNVANSCQDGPESRHLGLIVAKGWAESREVIHVHANLQIRGESKSHDLCWLFEPEGVPRTNHALDGLGITGCPSNDFKPSVLVRNWQTNQDSPVFIVIGE